MNHIYHYMDKLYSMQMDLAQQISVVHTRQIFGTQLGLMFYDLVAFYFEAVMTDVFRKPDFSKDGKTESLSQVVLGLLVSEDGYPLS